MRHGIYCFIVVVGLAGAAWAGAYNDQIDGDWNAPATWNAAAYPVVGDTATVDSNTVNVNINISGTDQVDQIILGGGTLLRSGGSKDIYSPISVTAGSTLSSPNESWTTNTLKLRGAITGAGLITMSGDYGRYDYYGDNSGFSGGFDLTAGNMWIRADGGLGTGTTTLAGYCQINATQTGTTPGTDAPTAVVVNSGGILEFYRNADYWDVTMNDGSRMQLRGDRDIGANGTVTASGTVTIDCNQGNEANYYLGDISGSGKLILTCTSNGGNSLGVGGDNSAYTGDIDVVAAGTGHGRVVYILDSNALGTDAAGGTVTVVSHRMGINADLARSFTMNAGTTVGMFGSNNATRVLGGTITLAGDARLYTDTNSNQNPTMQLDGQITGAGELTLLAEGTNDSGRFLLNNAANDFAGGLVIDCNQNSRAHYSPYVKANAAGALSTTTVDVLGSRLITTVDGALDSPSAIDIDGGALELGSTETAQFSLQEGSALIVSGGSTVLDYTPATGNVQIYNNAVLDKTSVLDAGDVPLASDIQGAAAQNQVIIGLAANDATEGWYGPGAGGNGGGAGQIIYAGVGTSDKAITHSGTIHEYTAGEGFSLASQKGRELTLSGSLDATGDINLVGGCFNIGGGVVVDQAGTINMDGSGRLYLNGVDALPASKVLEVNGGYVALSGGDSLANGSQVNVNSGAVFQATVQPTTGSVTAKTGGGVYVTAADALASGRIAFEAGAQLCLDQNNVTNLPTGGDVDFLIADGKRTITENIVLGDNTRLASAAAPPVSYPGPWNKMEPGGQVTTVGTQGRIAVMTDTYVQFDKEIALTGATLIINDANPWTAMDSYGTGYEEITYSGTIYLSNAANDCDALRIEAGTATAYGWANFGSPDSIFIAAGATFYPRYGGSGTWTVPVCTITGDGLIYPDSRDRSFVFEATTLSPGSSAGILTVDAGANPVQLLVSGMTYTTFEMEVVGNGATAGTDHDQVVFRGGGVGRYGNNLVNADLVVDIPVLPSIDCNPDDMLDKVLITTPDGAVEAGAFHEIRMGATNTERHWAIDAPSAVTYNADSVVLNASAISWTAIPGDADLDGSVLLSDLSILAFNWESDTGMDWSTADFDFNGVVNLADLSALAFHWEETESAGAPPVPEPMTVGLLVLGGAALLRRRRR